ncbi:MAG: hypothetical protein QOH07_3026 [Mycobacterium sp.]|jgi:hypothetical protein|nr:hypothetical protein [Mycobacterium sp.]MDT5254072.1 hypothetical protein [Mycobacterium sp.]
MSQSTTTSAISGEVVQTAAPTSDKDETSAAPVLITEQEVLFGTRVALLLRKASTPHRWIDAIRNAAGSVHLPPPRQHYPTDTGYLERSRMAREMDRL